MKKDLRRMAKPELEGRKLLLQMKESHSFKLSHGSVTVQKALDAAERVEAKVGESLNAGNSKALRKLLVEDLAILVQFVRNHEPVR